jgi:hypothetical protein
MRLVRATVKCGCGGEDQDVAQARAKGKTFACVWRRIPPPASDAARNRFRSADVVD